MELTIVDESDTGADIGSIHARQFVNCLSPPHGIDGRYACMSKTVDYLNPSGNTITIGASGIKLTSISAKQNENLSAIEDELLGQTATIEGISGKVDGIASSQNVSHRAHCLMVSVFLRTKARTVGFSARSIHGIKTLRHRFRIQLSSGIESLEMTKPMPYGIRIISE